MGLTLYGGIVNLHPNPPMGHEISPLGQIKLHRIENTPVHRSWSEPVQNIFFY